jgi:hypothetical protein
MLTFWDQLGAPETLAFVRKNEIVKENSGYLGLSVSVVYGLASGCNHSSGRRSPVIAISSYYADLLQHGFLVRTQTTPLLHCWFLAADLFVGDFERIGSCF